MKVAIIIINYQYYADRYLAACLASLEKIKFPRENYQVFVVDNHSTAESAAHLKRNWPNCEIIPNDKNDFGQGNNLGMAEAAAQGFDYLLLLNMDTEVHEDFLTAAIQAYESEPDIAMVQSRLMLFDDKQLINSIGNAVHYLGFGYCNGYRQVYTGRPAVEPITYASGAAVLISAENFRQIGGLPEDFFMYHEDLQWGLQARLAGKKAVLANQSVVYHKYEFNRSISKIYWMERNRFITVLATYKLPTLIIISIAALFMEIGLLIFALKGGWLKQKLRAYAWFFRAGNWQLVLKLRSRNKQLRIISDRELTKDFTGKIDYQEAVAPNWLLTHIGNPAFNLYWQIVKKIIFW